MVRSKSATKFLSTLADACLPVQRQPIDVRAADQHGGRPERQRLEGVGTAPDAAVEEDRHAAVDRLGDRGSASSEPTEPSTCRPPWLETTMPSMPCSTASRASSGWRMPLSTIGSLVCSRSQAKSAQVSDGRE